jgi:ankyrin repeat protein
MGWNLDSMEHATFNWSRPLPAYARAHSHFRPTTVKLFDRKCRIANRAFCMRGSNRRAIVPVAVVLLILVWATAIGPERSARISISSGELVRAVTIQRDSLIDLCLIEHVDPNGRDAQGRTPLLIATSQQDWKTARRLVDAGASVDLADTNGFTPLMAAAMHGNLEMFRLLLVRTADLHAEAQANDGRDLLGFALDGANLEIIETVVERLPPPTPEGKKVPFLAYAIAGNNSSLFSTLLTCGADPNTVLPIYCDKDFLALLSSKGLRSYVEEDRDLTVVMLAAGLGQDDYLRALLDAGANRSRLTSRDKMSALDIAAETGHWRAAQILLGGGPPPDRLRLEISLALQRVALVKNGVPVYRTQCSTGRPGYSTKRGEFVITNKERYHRSTIYHVDMPYFMRLSCLDFGMHAGYVPNRPASHGCIRLPEEAARKFFSELPVGTLVTVQ